MRMKSFLNNIQKRWNAETPKLVRLLQLISGMIAVIPTYYKNLPDEFRASVPSYLLFYIFIAGIIIAGLLQLFTKKDQHK